MTISNLQEAEKVLGAYVPQHGQLNKDDLILERIQRLMTVLGNPQDKLKVIHIAGTSGKTSTAYYIAALLKAGGQKVGLTVSPHVDSITERLQIDGQPVSEQLFCSELGLFMDEAAKADHRPTYFELLYAFTIWVMQRQAVDYAVVETGVGGLLDATNVATRADKVCVITDIGFDHQHLLGNSLNEIATQKAGIIHPGNQVVMYRQSEDVMAAVEKWVKEHRAKLTIAQETDEKFQAGLPAYQRRNWQLAHQVYLYLQGRDDLPALDTKALQASQVIRIPGRMETIQYKDKTLVLDGAHNGQKMSALEDSFKKLYPGQKPAVLLAVKEGKEYQELVPVLSPLASRLITTSYSAMQDLPIKAMSADKLAAAFNGKLPVSSQPNQSSALEELMNGPEKVCLITGSFYFLGQLRAKLV